MREIRVNGSHILSSFDLKKRLKKCGIRFWRSRVSLKEWSRNVYILALPENIRLEPSDFDEKFYLVHESGKRLGYVVKPYDEYGGFLNFIA